MSTYINTITGEYPRHIGDILILNPHADPTGAVLPEGWAQVQYTPPPSAESYDATTQVAVQLPPLKTEAGYVMQWAVRDMTERELYRLSDQYQKDIQPITPNTDLNISGSVPNVVG